MKRMFLMGRSEAGKTSLTQVLNGEELHYKKTQYTNIADDMIDSPGEYAESKYFSLGLACFSFEADVVAIVQAADDPGDVSGPAAGGIPEALRIDLVHKRPLPPRFLRHSSASCFRSDLLLLPVQHCLHQVVAAVHELQGKEGHLLVQQIL